MAQNYFNNLVTPTPVSAHRITLAQNVNTEDAMRIYAALSDEELKKIVDFLQKMGVQFHLCDDTKKKATLSSSVSEDAPAKKSSSSSKKKTGKASAPRKEREFWSYLQNAPLTGSVKLADFYEVTASKSGHQAVLEVSKELAPCWWYFLNACVREYNSIIAVKDGKDADMFPLKSYGHKIYCDRKVVNGGASFMLADSVESTESINRFIEVVNGYLTKTGKTSVKKAQAVYAKADEARRAEHEARKARKQA